ncbi:MAG: hypothetical protein M1572_04665 [Gammaproteobacteria bacterium]|nr:hypothetical protein [Gammaproteobacteria bacterium]HQT02943.1 hypothetical protein [Thiotrichales bacterium]
MPALDNNSVFDTISTNTFWRVTLNKRFVVWLLLGILPWLSLQTQASINVAAQNLEHQLAHIGHLAHHHEMNGDVHYDLSHESTQHLAEHDACAHQLGLIPEFVHLKLSSVHTQKYSANLSHFLPNPNLHKLQKPPKLH